MFKVLAQKIINDAFSEKGAIKHFMSATFDPRIYRASMSAAAKSANSVKNGFSSAFSFDQSENFLFFLCSWIKIKKQNEKLKQIGITKNNKLLIRAKWDSVSWFGYIFTNYSSIYLGKYNHSISWPLLIKNAVLDPTPMIIIAIWIMAKLLAWKNNHSVISLLAPSRTLTVFKIQLPFYL